MQTHDNGQLRKVGTFVVTRDTIDLKNKDWLDAVFSQVLIVRAEYLFIHDCIQYTALSENFRETSVMQALPEYKCFVEKKTAEDGSVSYNVKWEEMA